MLSKKPYLMLRVAILDTYQVTYGILFMDATKRNFSYLYMGYFGTENGVLRLENTYFGNVFL